MNKATITFTNEQGENETVEVGEPGLFVGRGNENAIRLSHASISRRHCVVREEGGEFFVSDLGSLNGTYVNGIPADHTRLNDGDVIRAGDVDFRFSSEGSRAGSFCAVDFDEDSNEIPKASLVYGLDEVVASIARDLNGILKITAKVSSIHDIEELQKELLREIFEVVPASEGAIILVDDEFGFAEVVGLNSAGSDERTIVSRTVVRKVLEERSVLLANDVVSDTRTPRSESLTVSGASSLICCPMILYDKVYGVVYLASKGSDGHFDESHVRFLTAIAEIASVAIENARTFSSLSAENAKLRAEGRLKKNMAGESPAMKKIFGFIAKAAPSEATILIEGESGTGKELAARAVQVNSRRSEGPFIVVNCATLTENLLESELFGHEKGAFTGALSQKKGKVEIADGGTLFLDEVGELPLNLQAKLLRMLQEREFERVGSTRSISVNVRIIAATNKDLEKEVEAGRFRRDLFFRLNVMKVTLPPLRERGDDVGLLADSFLKKFCAKYEKKIRGFSERSRTAVLTHGYPGNVRELENAIERAVVLSSGDWITLEDLPDEMNGRSGDAVAFDGADTLPLQEGVKSKKKEMIIRAFQKANGSYVDTAKILDVHPNYLHRLIRNLDIKSDLENLSS